MGRQRKTQQTRVPDMKTPEASLLQPEKDMAKKERYVAHRPFIYSGKEVDRLQVLELGGLLNDEKLIRLNYVRKLDDGISLTRCGFCGADFCSDTGLSAHGNLRHAGQDRDSDEFADAIERQHEIANQTAPLRLDQTKASLTA